MPDENIVYIGRAGSLRKRIGDYYRTPLGDSKPHAGGHWIKTLAVLPEVRVYFVETEDYEHGERSLLTAFVQGVSKPTREALFDPTLPIPFANLEHPPGTRKDHGIRQPTRDPPRKSA
jgi:hypothetical protein